MTKTIALIVLSAVPALAGGGAKASARPGDRRVPAAPLPIANHFVDSRPSLVGVVARLPAAPEVRERILREGERILEKGQLLATPWNQGHILLASRDEAGPGAIMNLKRGRGFVSFSGSAREAVRGMSDYLWRREGLDVSRELDAGYALMRKFYDGPWMHGDDNVKWEKALATDRGMVIAAHDARDGRKSVLRALDFKSRVLRRVNVPNQYYGTSMHEIPLSDGRVLLKLTAARPKDTERLAAADPADADLEIFLGDAGRVDLEKALPTPDGKSLAQLEFYGRFGRAKTVELLIVGIESGVRKVVTLTRRMRDALLQGFSGPDRAGRVYALIQETAGRDDGRRWAADLRTGRLRAP